MTIEAFNWWLAIGGAVVVPTAVGVTAHALVKRSNDRLASAMHASPWVKSYIGLEEEPAADEDRVPV